MKREETKPLKNSDKHHDQLLEDLIAAKGKKVVTPLQPSKDYRRKNK